MYFNNGVANKYILPACNVYVVDVWILLIEKFLVNNTCGIVLPLSTQ